MQGLSQEAQDSLLEVYFRGDDGNSQPTGSDFTIRLANSLLLRLTGSATADWTADETVEGSSSGDTGTLEGTKSNGDGTITLKLSDISDTDVFQIGETVTGQSSGASGVIDNANLNLSSLSGYFQPNEEIVDQSSGATADVKKVAGDVIEINNLNGDFGIGNSVEGLESGSTATIEKHYPGFPGLFQDDGYSNILGEPGNYTAQTIDADSSSTGWITKGTDGAGNKFIRSAEVQFSSTDSNNLGPINLGVLTVQIGTDNEKLIGVAPLKGSPPSKNINANSTITFQYEQTLGG